MYTKINDNSTKELLIPEIINTKNILNHSRVFNLLMSPRWPSQHDTCILRPKSIRIPKPKTPYQNIVPKSTVDTTKSLKLKGDDTDRTAAHGMYSNICTINSDCIAGGTVLVVAVGLTFQRIDGAVTFAMPLIWLLDRFFVKKRGVLVMRDAKTRGREHRGPQRRRATKSASKDLYEVPSSYFRFSILKNEFVMCRLILFNVKEE